MTDRNTPCRKSARDLLLDSVRLTEGYCQGGSHLAHLVAVGTTYRYEYICKIEVANSTCRESEGHLRSCHQSLTVICRRFWHYQVLLQFSYIGNAVNQTKILELYGGYLVQISLFFTVSSLLSLNVLWSIVVRALHNPVNPFTTFSRDLHRIPWDCSNPTVSLGIASNLNMNLKFISRRPTANANGTPLFGWSSSMGNNQLSTRLSCSSVI